MEVTLHSSKSQPTSKSQPILLSYQALASLIHALPDHPDYQLFYSEHAGHPSLQVREAVASKNHLSESAIHQLVRDPSTSVLEPLLYNPTAQAVLSADILIGLVTDSVEAARAIAYTLERWNDRKSLIESLSTHTDPSVRHALADNASTPKPVLAQLTKDSDPAVKEAAQRSLRGRSVTDNVIDQ